METNTTISEKIKGWFDVRVWISVLVIVISAFGIGWIASNVFKSSTNENSLDAAKYVFNALIPILSTWVGSIIAFYFSKENFEAANKNVREMVDKITPMEKLKSISVKDKMMNIDKVIKFQMENNKSDKDYSIKEIRNKFADMNRLLILDPLGVGKYIIHKSLIDQFVTEKYMNTNVINIEELTLHQVHEDKYIGNMMDHSFGVVSENATLADAKIVMESIKEALDVIVTKTGALNEPVTGWITSVIISENAKV